ncbi:hypothetical protein PRIPAC_82979, partial [Pristionchus pacificus]|uniref:Uncharacterized protein n=1 Tax=Pristionchus pacificus TaxID=54126 RepID=A0A2A6BXI4_PRIPA
MGSRTAKPVRYTCAYFDFPYCECKSHVRSPDLRVAMYRDIRDAVYEREFYKNIAMYFIFNGIFNLRNAQYPFLDKFRFSRRKNCIVTFQFMRYYLPRFADIFIEMSSLPYEHCERKMLSGLVLFRTELLPIFCRAINVDTDFMPLILRILHWESVIRNALSGKTEKHPAIYFNMKRFEQMLNAEIAALKKSQRYACEHCNDPRCACEVDASRSDLRVAIFNDIRSAVLQPESFRKTAVFMIMYGIFSLRNANGGKCFMQYYLPLFTEIFISMPIIATHNERQSISTRV